MATGRRYLGEQGLAMGGHEFGGREFVELFLQMPEKYMVGAGDLDPHSGANYVRIEVPLPTFHVHGEALRNEIRAYIESYAHDLLAPRASNDPMVGNPVFDGNITSEVNPAGSVTGGGGGGGGGDAPGVHAGSVTGGGGGDAPGVHAGSVTGRGGGDVPGVGVQLNNDMLMASAARARGHAGSEAGFVDESGGRFFVIQINPPPQGSRTTEDGLGELAQRALQSAFGGIVPLCYSILDDTLKDGCPGYIKAATYTGLTLITGFTYVGLISKKRANAAVRVVASTCTAALSIAIVNIVSENVYIKGICGFIGAVATLATMAIKW